MNGNLVLAGVLLLSGCAVIAFMLFLTEAHDGVASRADVIDRAADPEDIPVEEPEPDREPVSGNVQPQDMSDRVEPEPPDPIRLQKPGWWIWGLVHTNEYAPVAGATVAFELETGSIDRDLQWYLETARSDTLGRYAVRFENPFLSPGLAPAGKMPFELKGRTFAPGYIQPDYHDDDFLIDVSREHFSHRSDFLLVEGSFLHGFVHEPGGAPAAGAAVMLCDPSSGRERATAYTGGNGEYFMTLDARGAHSRVEPGRYALFAALAGTGVSRPIPIGVEAGKSAEAPPLSLQACGMIAGTTERPDGTPVEDVKICAFPRSRSEEREHGLHGYSDGFPGHKRAEFDLATIGAGHTFGTATSGANGRFCVSGLRPGEYVLEVSWDTQSRESEDQDLDSIHVDCKTGDRGVRIVLSNYELRVLLLDEQGQRIPRAKLFCTSGPLESGQGGEVVGGEAKLLIAPGPLRLQATAGDRLMARHESTVPVGSYRNEVRLLLRKVDLGSLCLQIRYHDGRPMEREAPLVMTAVSDNDLRYFEEHQFRWDDSGRAVVDLVPDRYELSLMTQYQNWMFNPDWMARPVVVENVIVEEGVEADLPVTLNPAGALRITLHCDGPVSYPWDTAFKATRVDCTSSQPRTLCFLSLPGSKYGASFKYMKTDTPYFAQRPLAPGVYQLEVEAVGFAGWKGSFSIRDRGVTDVEVWLSTER